MDVNFKTGDPHHPKWTQTQLPNRGGGDARVWEASRRRCARGEHDRGQSGRRVYKRSAREARISANGVCVEYGFCPDGGGLKVAAP